MTTSTPTPCPECARLRLELQQADADTAHYRRRADELWETGEAAHEARHAAERELDAWRTWAELHFTSALAHLGDDTMRAAILTEVGR